MPAIPKQRWEAIGPHLDALLDLDAAQRADRLEQLRLADRGLADEIAMILAREEAVEREHFLEGSALAEAGEMLGPCAGRQVGAYTLERALGRGGMGSVWLARRSDRQFEGMAAVKFPNLALLTRGGTERFAREGSVLARLAHPNIARLLDAGVTDSGQPYLVLEYVEGVPIDRWCDTRQLDVGARVRLVLDVLAAVSHAHGRLILHRDLKPSNILVTREGQVKLLDFGIAKLIDDGVDRGQPTELTRLAGRAFTPEFAAPEQVRAEDATIATDVYALGVLLYVLLSGRHPTASDTQTPVEQLEAVIDTVPVRLSQAARTAGGRLPAGELSGDLDIIVAKALKKIPRERYASVAALSDDLSRYLRNQPIEARPDSRGYRLRKFVQRHRLGAGAASLTLFALIAGTIGTTWQAIDADRERDRAVFEAERAFAQSKLFNLMLAAMDSDQPLTQREILRRSIALVERQYAHDPRLAIDFLLPIAGQYMTIGDANGDLAVMRRAGELAASSQDPGLIANVACDTVETEIARGRPDLARLELDKGLAALARAVRPDSRSRAACLNAEAALARRHGDLDLARDRVREAIRIAEEEGRTRQNTYPKLLSFLAVLEQERGDLVASHAIFHRIVRLHEEAGDTGTLDYLGARRNEAVILMAWGEYRQAQSILAGFDLRWREAAGENELPPWIASVLGRLALRFDRLDDADRILTAAVARARVESATEDALTIELWLAQVHVQRGRFAEAQRLLELQGDRDIRPGRWLLLTPATLRAASERARGEFSTATATIDAEIARIRSTKRDARALATALREAARIHLAAGEIDKAMVVANDAVAAWQKIARNAAASADVGEALLLLAHAQRAAGQRSESASTARSAAQALGAGLADDHRLTREALTLAGS